MSATNSAGHTQGGKAAKMLYLPVGIMSSVAASAVAGALFKQVWKRVSPQSEGDAPGPLQSEFPLKEILAAAVLQGAIVAGIRALVQRQGAKAFAKATGEWPGD